METMPNGDMMLTNNIMALLKIKNNGNISELQKAIGLTYKATYDLAHGKTEGIKLSTLNSLCKFFGVGPGEIFIYIPDKKE